MLDGGYEKGWFFCGDWLVGLKWGVEDNVFFFGSIRCGSSLEFRCFD